VSQDNVMAITLEAVTIVEPVQQTPRPQVAPRSVWSSPRPGIRDRDIAAAASHLRLDKPAEVRLHLQRRAPANLRHHVQRAAVRLAVLIVMDLLVFGAMRELVRGVRDHAWLGASLAATLQATLPTGMLNGWQYAVALFVSLVVLGNYGPGDQRRDPRRLFAACALATALPLWDTLFTRGFEPVLVQYAVTVVLVWLGLVTERLTINRITAWVRPPEKDAVDTLFVGPGAACFEAASSPAFAAGTDYRPIGFVDVQIPPAPGALGHVSDIPLLLAGSGARIVALCGYLTDKQFQDVVDVALAGGCQVLAVPRAAEIAGVHPNTVWRRGQPLVQLTAPSLKGQQLAVKRALDLVGATIGLILATPLLAVLAALIKLGSRGPVFFTQGRVGQGGQLFKIFKLRTMVDGAESHRDELMAQSVYHDARLFKVPRDPRMTRLGNWLRRTSLDELPQLLNVLKGEMSLVGPRPPLPSEVALYEAHHYARFDVKPGMTGPWQVAGRNQVTDFERVIALEAEYIRNWSLARDLWILLRTVPVVLEHRGAH
jgi:exopolysaccharide biosynthesis polyprenyl glycosylphosphotransferase